MKRYRMSLQEFSLFSISLHVSSSLMITQTCVLDSDCGGPPQNIRAWIKYVAACVQVRYVQADPWFW